MLKKTYRLKRQKEFKALFQKKQLVKEGFLILKMAPNNKKESRFGVVVSQKVSKKAVVRNKIKRQIRAIIFRNLQKIKKGYDLVFIVLPGFEKNNFYEMATVINKMLTKAKLYA